VCRGPAWPHTLVCVWQLDPSFQHAQRNDKSNKGTVSAQYYYTWHCHLLHVGVVCVCVCVFTNVTGEEPVYKNQSVLLRYLQWEIVYEPSSIWHIALPPPPCWCCACVCVCVCVCIFTNVQGEEPADNNPSVLPRYLHWEIVSEPTPTPTVPQHPRNRARRHCCGHGWRGRGLFVPRARWPCVAANRDLAYQTVDATLVDTRRVHSRTGRQNSPVLHSVERDSRDSERLHHRISNWNKSRRSSACYRPYCLLPPSS